MVMVWALSGFPGGTWQIVTLGTAAWAEAPPSPSFAVAVSTAAVGLDCLSALQPKSANVTAQITDNRAGVLLFMADPLFSREDGRSRHTGMITILQHILAGRAWQ
jgi:hypothetical protein